MKSILAGMFIALGCCAYISIPDKLIGALCFSMGLLGIRLFKLDLYTGKTQFFLKRGSKYSPASIFWIFIGNIFGVYIIYWLSILSPVSIAGKAIGESKNLIPWATLIFNSIMCGALMTIATYKETPLWISSLAVVAFIMAGFNHSIADAFYFMLVGGWEALAKVCVIAIGNLIGGRAAAIGLDNI